MCLGIDWHRVDGSHHRKDAMRKGWYGSDPMWFYHTPMHGIDHQMGSDSDPIGCEWIDADNCDESIYSFIRRDSKSKDILIYLHVYLFFQIKP